MVRNEMYFELDVHLWWFAFQNLCTQNCLPDIYILLQLLLIMTATAIVSIPGIYKCYDYLIIIAEIIKMIPPVILLDL